MFDKAVLLELYGRLLKAYGRQNWWPADSPFEVMVGAVLTQNTAWTNVEKAITNLREADELDLAAMQRMTERRLAVLIRPAGYFNVKARRLKSMCKWLVAQGGISALRDISTGELRERLLAVHGIGPETADDILLYALDRPVFVIDAYTRRLLKALAIARGDEDYEDLRGAFEAALDPEPALYNEYHALIVRHAKEKCACPARCRRCSVEVVYEVKSGTDSI